MSRLQMDRDWLVYHPAPKKPDYLPPSGAVDAHCHVFGPGEEFPYAPERKYTPCDAPKEKLWELRDYLGFERNVIVQATCHGADNRAMVDALRASNNRARGVATVTKDFADEQLREMDAAGVRGVRFNFVKRLVDVTPREVLAQREQLLPARVAGRVLALGRVGKLRARPEHVAVRIHAVGRQLEARLAGTRVPVQPAGRLLEASSGGFAHGCFQSSWAPAVRMMPAKRADSAWT